VIKVLIEERGGKYLILAVIVSLEIVSVADKDNTKLIGWVIWMAISNIVISL
jgi:hypothetical protein